MSAVATASADEFSLKGGGQLQGVLVSSNEDDAENLEIRTSHGARILLAADQVLDAKLLSPIERRYEELLPKMPPNVQGMWTMAEWCRENRLTEQRKVHLEQILELEPDHKGARAALGFSRVNGRWIITAEWRRQQGFVRQGATWKLAQEIVLEERADKFEEREIAWKRKVKIWRGQLNRRRGATALAELRAVTDVAAASAFAEALEEEANRDLRKIYIERLGEMTRSGAATTALAKHAMEDVDPLVREAALDQLERNKVTSVVTTFIRALKHDDNQLVNRAAIGLARMNDQRAIAPLIDALITEHKQVVGSGGGPGQIGAGFGGAGAGGLSVGGSAKLLKGQRRNPAVNQALAVLTGVNFMYDKDRWRRWYAEQNTPEFVNLRRDS